MPETLRSFTTTRCRSRDALSRCDELVRDKYRYVKLYALRAEIVRMLFHARRAAAMPLTFKTVFEAGDHGYSTWWFPAFGLIFVFMTSLLVFQPAFISRVIFARTRKRLPRAIFLWFCLTFTAAWTSTAFVATYTQYKAASMALRDRDYQVVEGPVTNFVAMPFTGHAQESFVVNGVRFRYSDYIVTSGFNKTASHGGPIRNGLYVRVTHVGNLILRLEVAK